LLSLLPFTQAQFLEVFREYNQGIGIGQSLILGTAVMGLAFAFWDNRVAGRVVSATLAMLWLWMGLVYHAIYFSRINPAAPVFAILFVGQAGLFLWEGVSHGRLRFRFTSSFRGWCGALVIVYSIAVYPALGFVFGHYYPAAPTFGAPCPGVLFTLGLLLWSNASWRLQAIPGFWAVVGTSAAVLLQMPQDYALAAAALMLFLLPRQRLQ
jgi:hypothetical protein